MKKLRKRLFLTGGFNTIALGTGRKEFNPKTARPGLEEYLKEAGQGTLVQIGGAANVDECVIGNFMASRFNRQANLPAFMPFIDQGLLHKPAVRVEGACATGGLALLSAVRSVLAETAEVALVIGVEVQNAVKAVYGADFLAGAAWAKERKAGHAHFFPGQFSNRAGAYFERFGRGKTRRAMARWYRQAIENARLCPTAQEYHNQEDNLEALASVEPDSKMFVDHLTNFDCSKVSDGASAIAVVSEQGLERIGVSPKDAVEIIAFAQAEGDITKPPKDPTVLDTTQAAVQRALSSAGIGLGDLSTIEIHDCFSIAAILGVEAFGLAEHGQGADFILAGNTARGGKIPLNTTGGLIGWGHPTGATGVHQAVTIWEQLTGKCGKAQLEVPKDRPFAMSVNMGGDDKTLVTFIYRKI